MWTKKFQIFFQVAGCLAIGLLAVYGLMTVFGGGSPAWAAIGQAIPNLQAPPRVPNVLTYQGMLRQPDGTPLDGTYDMTFRLYDAPVAGNLRHTEVISPVVVREGLFTVLLGDTVAIGPAAFAGPLYISVQVGSEPEMAPRQRIAPVAYAVQLTDGVYVDESGQVGIGTTDPQTQLDVTGNVTVTGQFDVWGNANVVGPLWASNLGSTGDISWGGHLINISVSGEYETSGWNGSDSAVTMLPTTYSMCYLILVKFYELRDNDHDAECFIDSDGTNWVLRANTRGGDADAVCRARCLQW